MSTFYLGKIKNTFEFGNTTYEKAFIHYNTRTRKWSGFLALNFLRLEEIQRFEKNLIQSDYFINLYFRLNCNRFEISKNF